MTTAAQLLVVVMFHRLKQNWKSDDDDDDETVHKLCSQTHNVQTVKLTLYKYKSWWHVPCKINLDYKRSSSVILGY